MVLDYLIKYLLSAPFQEIFAFSFHENFPTFSVAIVRVTWGKWEDWSQKLQLWPAGVTLWWMTQEQEVWPRGARSCSWKTGLVEPRAISVSPNVHVWPGRKNSQVNWVSLSLHSASSLLVTLHWRTFSANAMCLQNNTVIHSTDSLLGKLWIGWFSPSYKLTVANIRALLSWWWHCFNCNVFICCDTPPVWKLDVTNAVGRWGIMVHFYSFLLLKVI